MSGRGPAQRFLPIGDYYFGADPIRVHTVLGTCVSITLWHPPTGLGGICHYLLPSRGGGATSARAPRGAYADEVMELFAESLRRSRTRAQDYVVKIFGGGNMFPDQVRGLGCNGSDCATPLRATCPSVGCKNISAGRRLLAQRGFSIKAEDVGGHGSRQVLFDIWSGDVWVRQGATMSQGLAAAV